MFLFILSFLIRRLAQGALIVFLVTFVIFALLRVIPGDPTRVILGPMASEEVRENAAIELGLNKPIPVQYLSYVKDLSKGDFGKSFIRGKQGGSMGGSQDSKGLDLELDKKNTRSSISGADDGVVTTALPTLVSS